MLDVLASNDTRSIPLAVALIVACVSLGSASPVAMAQTTTCGLGDISHTGITKCYPPAATGAAERLMAVPVVSPRGLVWRLTGLRLTQVSIVIDASRRATSIDYVFGRIPTDSQGLADYVSRRFPYVLVHEFVPGLGPSYKPYTYYEELQGPGLGGTWEFAAQFPFRSLGLHLITNQTRRVVQRVGYALLREARGGK